MIPPRLRFGPVRRVLKQHRNHAESFDHESFSLKSPSLLPRHHVLATGRPTRTNQCHSLIPRLFWRLGLVLLGFISLLVYTKQPPTFESIRMYERNLPQHNAAEALSGMTLTKNSTYESDRRYLRFEGGLKGRGWNNILQEDIVMAYIAHLAKRSFVFEDYVWSHSPLGFTFGSWELRPARIPLNAFISGPIAGGSIEGDPSISQRSVSLEFFDTVCPADKRVFLSSKGAPQREDVNYMMRWWMETLEKVSQDPCVVINADQVLFDDSFFGGQFLDLFPALRTSAILSEFSWSPLVYSAVARNWRVFGNSSPKSIYDFQHRQLDGLVTVHLRRGDFRRHCVRMKRCGGLFMGMNYFEGITDRFNPDQFKKDSIENQPNITEAEVDKMLLDYYVEHCNPDDTQIIETLRRIRKENQHAKKLFLMTNGNRSWLEDLAKELWKDGWEDIKSSYDLTLEEEQFHISGAIDMAIAEKAEFFLGNGFSSLSSNVVMLRVLNGFKASSNHFF